MIAPGKGCGVGVTDASELERAVYLEAAAKHLATETEAHEIDARIREHL